ncbi:MAG TPA: MFS transporter [Gaiellaceae bacterium]|nr:MFS transporter [Gaiellaceae bacterium]
MATDTRLRAAHAALAFAFLALGAIDGTWAARLPAIEHGLGLDSGQLGLVIFAVSLAATLSLPLAGWLTARRGSSGPTQLGVYVGSLGLTLAAFAPGMWALVPAACVMGVGIGTLDVAMNAHGVTLEERVGRPLLSALHGSWSIGLLSGSALAAVAAAAGAGPKEQFPVVSVILVGAALLVLPRLLPGHEDVARGSATFALPHGALALPAFLTFCSIFVETATMSWSAVFLAGPAKASAAVAAGGVVAFSIAMAAARFRGDRLTVRWGVAGLARRGGLLSAGGMLLALATRSPAPALFGFACVGAGCAAIVPALFRVAAGAPGVASGAGIAAVATMGYLGGVSNGPAIGFLARGVGLTKALGLVVVGSLLIAVLGPRLERQR